VCAKIPDLDKESQLYVAVAKQMMHGPCSLKKPNSPCMEDRKQFKNYPMQTQDTTEQDGNGRVLYCRQTHGGYVEKHILDIYTSIR
jgi:hypothetical protein